MSEGQKREKGVVRRSKEGKELSIGQKRERSCQKVRREEVVNRSEERERSCQKVRRGKGVVRRSEEGKELTYKRELMTFFASTSVHMLKSLSGSV